MPAAPGPAARATGFHCAAFALSCAYALLVFCQLNTRTDLFSSDLGIHAGFIASPGDNPAASYSLLHTLGGWMLGWSGLTGADALLFAGGAMLVLLVAAFHGSQLAVHAYFQRAYPARSEWLVAGCTLAVFLVSMLMLQPWVNTLYLGIFTPNPWHNPTYVFGRFFSILAFCQFVRLLGPDERPTTRGVAALAAFTALSVWGKPSFLIGFLPAALAVLGWGAWRRWFTLRPALGLALALVPAVCVLLWIDHKVFASGAATGKVGFAPGRGWGLYTPSFTLSLSMGMLFPLYVLVVRLRHLSRLMLTASATWLASCAAFLLLEESGLRATHANFAWCYMSGMFFMYLGAIAEWFLGTPVSNRLLRWLGTALFLLHLVSGVRYFLRVLAGLSYG